MMSDDNAMSDGLLSTPDREEALSRVFLQAIAASAGYVMAEPNFDRDGVDVVVSAGGAMRPSIAFQLKATINLGEDKDGRFLYPLKRRNYDLLREPTQAPRLLAVLSLPKDEKDWISLTADELVLRRSMFWLSLASFPDTENKENITVPIPTANRLDVECLRRLMEQSRTGTII